MNHLNFKTKPCSATNMAAEAKERRRPMARPVVAGREGSKKGVVQINPSSLCQNAKHRTLTGIAQTYGCVFF